MRGWKDRPISKPKDYSLYFSEKLGRKFGAYLVVKIPVDKKSEVHSSLDGSQNVLAELNRACVLWLNQFEYVAKRSRTQQLENHQPEQILVETHPFLVRSVRQLFGEPSAIAQPYLDRDTDEHDQSSEEKKYSSENLHQLVRWIRHWNHETQIFYELGCLEFQIVPKVVLLLLCELLAEESSYLAFRIVLRWRLWS